MSFHQLRTLGARARIFQRSVGKFSTSTHKLHEYFVMVRNNPKPLQSDSGPFALKGHLPGLTFAGHMLSAQSNGTNAADVQGSCFAINAASTADATETIRAHPYCKNGIWNPESIEVWPLETVLTSHMGTASRLELQ